MPRLAVLVPIVLALGFPVFAPGRAHAQDAPQVDRFGGRKDLRLSEPAKFFHVRSDGQRWWFVTPEGNAFLAPGVCHVNSSGDYAPKLGTHPYHDNILAKYGSIDRWAQVAGQRLRDWGFTTLAAWCSEELRGQFPYTIELGMSGGLWGKGAPDVFSEQFKKHVDQRAANAARTAADPFLLGYYLDNELPWAPDWRTLPEVFQCYVTLPTQSSGKQKLVEFFRQRYQTTEALARVWTVNAKDWSDLAAATSLIPRDAARAKEDREAFTLLVARQYFKETTEAIRRNDPNHLILGCRFVWRTVPKVVVQACGEACDVVSINYYEVGPIGKALLASVQPGVDWFSPDPSFREFHQLTGKPLMITEFGFRAEDSGMPNTYPPGWLVQPTVKDQKRRAEKYRHYVTTWIGSPYFVGYHWFEYADEPKTGRFDGENGNYGLVNIDDEPYAEFVGVVRDVNRKAWDLHRRAGAKK